MQASKKIIGELKNTEATPESKYLINTLKRTHTERFEFLTELIKTGIMLKKAKKIHKKISCTIFLDHKPLDLLVPILMNEHILVIYQIQRFQLV